MSKVTIRVEKLAEAAIKQIATHKFWAEKKEIQKWKKLVIYEVVRELHPTKKMHEEAIKA